MALNSIRRVFIQSVAEIVKKKLDELINDPSDVSKNIIDHLPSFLENIKEAEIMTQLKKCILADPYYTCNSLSLPIYKTAFNLSPPKEYDDHDVKEFFRDIFHDKCLEIKLKTGRTILPSIIAKEVYKQYHPFSGRINPKTGLPIQKEINAHRKSLNDFEDNYYEATKQNGFSRLDDEYGNNERRNGYI